MWNLACPDWETRLRAGRSLVPDLPLFREEADLATAFFDNLRLPDVPDVPMLRDGDCIGLLVFGVGRRREFTAQEIVVAESFRDQALIAIENFDALGLAVCNHLQANAGVYLLESAGGNHR